MSRKALMESADQSWETIFRQQGRFFNEAAPLVVQFAGMMEEHGCRKVLDLGCGSGRHVVLLAEQGYRVCGVDNSPTGLELSRVWLRERGLSADLALADGRSPLPFSDEAFDALLTTQVIHHALLATVQRTSWEIERVVRPGGMLLVTVPAGKHEDEAMEEVEPRTFLPLEGPEMGLPHHIFYPEELPALFPAFRPVEVSVRGGVVIALFAIRQ